MQRCKSAGESRELLPAEVLGTSLGRGDVWGRGHVWGRGANWTPLARMPMLDTVMSAGAVCPALLALSRCPQGAPLARGCREVPRVPGLGAGDCPAARPRRCVPAPRLPQGVASPGGKQQADLPNDYNCLLGADSKLICFLVQGP